MSAFLQNTLIVGGLVLVGLAGYYLYVQNATLEVQDDPLSMQIQLETADFLRKLNELKAIELNGDIFADPRFSTLINFSVPVLPEPFGTTDPFYSQN
jgi:hypothetical protein